MELRNLTPFPNLRFYGADNRGHEFGVLFAKGTYAVAADGALVLAEEQAPPVFTDTYHGELNASSLRLPSDIVPRKPRSDVIVNGVARPPGGAPSPSWLCGIRVDGRHRLEKRLRVTGPRWWEPVFEEREDDQGGRRFRHWRLTEPEPVAEVPIRYELAYGGLLARPGENGEPFHEAYEPNPIGRGWLDEALTPRDRPVPAPQIEAADDPVAEPMRHHRPQGLGPIPPAWLPRRPLGGTFDARWQAETWPNWPEDYNFAYHNSAHPDLIHPGFLDGDEEIRLVGLDGGTGPRRLRLPGHRLQLALDGGDDHGRRLVPMELDTLVIDVADPDPEEHRVFLSWRANFPATGISGLTLLFRDAAAAAAEGGGGTAGRAIEAMEA
jgi:hypothetical protein